MNINDIIPNKQPVFYNADGKLANLLSFFTIILISFYFYTNEKELHVRIWPKSYPNSFWYKLCVQCKII